MTNRSFARALVTSAVLAAVTLVIPRAVRAQDPGTHTNAPFLIDVQVVGRNSPVPCEGDSVRVLITGQFPIGCYSIRSVEIYYPRCLAPCAPSIIVNVSDFTCRGFCPFPTPPWRIEATYGPLAAGSYHQTVTIRRSACADTIPPPVGPTLTVPFAVRPECGNLPGPCLLTDWVDAEPLTRCNATLDPEGRARLALRVATPVALRGLQGRLSLTDPALRITSLEPIGPAAGMTMVWQPIPGGAEFTMFSAGSARIPPTPTSSAPPPVLGVGIGKALGHVPFEQSFLFEGRMLGADEAGNPVPACPIMTLAVRGAMLCNPSSVCDANGDGRRDVSDLVRMLICLPSCPESADFDCDGNQDFNLDDVICCARRMLRESHPPTPSRPGGERLAFGTPQRTDFGWRVPLRLGRTADLGAVRLALRFPTDRFQFRQVVQRPGAPNWLTLSELDGEVGVLLGLLNLSSGSLVYPPGEGLELDLEFELRDGQSPGGSVGITAADFSGQDGDILDVPLPADVPIPSGISLSSGQPNPFANTTRFVVRLEQPGQVRIAVHDLSGRRVALLFDGPLGAGQKEIHWNGRDDAGVPLRDGIYFVRGSGAGQEISRKVALLRQR